MNSTGVMIPALESKAPGQSEARDWATSSMPSLSITYLELESIPVFAAVYLPSIRKGPQAGLWARNARNRGNLHGSGNWF